MSLEAFPMESEFLGNDIHGNPVFDKAVGALFFRNFWKHYFTDGVFANPSDTFKVYPSSGMKLRVRLGCCHIQGVTALPSEAKDEYITLNEASSLYDRTDRIVLRADFEDERTVSIQVRENWQQGHTLERGTDVYELALADVLVRKSASSVTTSDITDLRLNSELCGVVTEPILRSNSGVFFDRLESELAAIKSQWESHKTTATAEQTALINAIKNWYDEVQVDIAKLQIFDFDNVSGLPGVTRTTSFSGSVITETIKLTQSQKQVAKRVTTISGDTITTKVTVYNADGQSVFKETTSTCQMGTQIVDTVV